MTEPHDPTLLERYRDRRMTELERAQAAMDFYEWLKAEGLEDAAIKFIELGLLDGRRP